MSILQTTELKKYYGSKPNITKALDGVTLSIEDGEFVAIVGTSGSGKSTLLNMMGGLDTPTSGSIKVKGKELSKFKDEQLTIFRRRNIGFIFQNYNLVPVLNVYENIVLPVELDGDTVDKHFMNEVVKMLALDEKLNSMSAMVAPPCSRWCIPCRFCSCTHRLIMSLIDISSVSPVSQSSKILASRPCGSRMLFRKSVLAPCGTAPPEQWPTACPVPSVG